MYKYLAYFLFAFIFVIAIGCEEEDSQVTTKQSDRDDTIIKSILKERGIDSTVYKTTESGLYYYYLTQLPSNTVPRASKFIEVDYAGKFPYGLTFDQGIIEMQGITGRSINDRDSCVSLSNGGVIAGWVETLSFLKQNEEVRIFVPSALAYGVSGSSGIPSNSVLEFDMKIISSKDTVGLLCR